MRTAYWLLMRIPVNLALRKKSSSICVAIREDLLTKAISFACLATNKLVSLSFFRDVEGSKNLQHTHNQLISSPALNSPSNSFSPVGPTIFTEPSNFPSCIQQSSAIFSKESRMMKDSDHTENIWEPIVHYRSISSLISSIVHDNWTQLYGLARFQPFGCRRSWQRHSWLVRSGCTKTGRGWLCTNSTAVALSPKPVSFVDLWDLETLETWRSFMVLWNSDDAKTNNLQNCQGSMTLDLLRNTKENTGTAGTGRSARLALVGVLAFPMSHAIQEPLTPTSNGNQLTDCCLSYTIYILIYIWLWLYI